MFPKHHVPFRLPVGIWKETGGVCRKNARKEKYCDTGVKNCVIRGSGRDKESKVGAFRGLELVSGSQASVLVQQGFSIPMEA